MLWLRTEGIGVHRTTIKGTNTSDGRRRIAAHAGRRTFVSNKRNGDNILVLTDESVGQAAFWGSMRQIWRISDGHICPAFTCIAHLSRNPPLKFWSRIPLKDRRCKKRPNRQCQNDRREAQCGGGVHARTASTITPGAGPNHSAGTGDTAAPMADTINRSCRFNSQPGEVAAQALISRIRPIALAAPKGEPNTCPRFGECALRRFENPNQASRSSDVHSLTSRADPTDHGGIRH